jgi:hypothetical protein
MPIIHVNSNTIRSNKKNKSDKSPLSVRKTRSGRAEYGDSVLIYDSNGNVVARVVYQPETPLTCGAQVWIETEFAVKIEGNNNNEITNMVQ